MKQSFGVKYTKTLQVGKNPVWFLSEGKKLAGNIFVPDTFIAGNKLPAVITVTPAGAVKEQTAGQHALALSQKGYITLAFDYRSFGESEGFPRYREDPFMKSEDIKNAVTFMSCLKEVDEERIGLLGICSGAGYSAFSATFDIRVKAVATISGIFDFAGWINGTDVMPFDEMLKKSAAARKKYYETGEAEYVNGWYGEAYDDFDKNVIFWKEAKEYYREGGNREHYEVTNGDYRDAQCIDTRYMLNANPTLQYLSPRPILAIRGSVAVTGPMSDEAIDSAVEPKELFTIEGGTHIDLYHKEEFVSQSVEKLATFYDQFLVPAR